MASVYKPLSHLGLVVAAAALLSGTAAAPHHVNPAPPSAEDQIFNQGASAPTVSFSLLQFGLGSGSVDGGGNVTGDPLVSDADGPDNIPGSADDRVSLAAASPAINAGNDAALPPDKFDLDGDGDFGEPIPTDVLGAARVDDTGPIVVVDMGAHEADASVVSVEPGGDFSDRGVALTPPYPNPMSEAGSVRFFAPRGGLAEVVVYDVLGRKRLVIYDGVVRPAQEYTLEFDARHLESGVYFVRVKLGADVQSAQFMVVR